MGRDQVIGTFPERRIAGNAPEGTDYRIEPRNHVREGLFGRLAAGVGAVVGEQVDAFLEVRREAGALVGGEVGEPDRSNGPWLTARSADHVQKRQLSS